MREMEIEVPVEMTIEATDTVNVPTPVPVDYDHNRLKNRDKAKAHPISAIDGLTEALGEKIDVEPNHSLMSDAEHTKLAGIQAGAQVNLIESVKVNGSPLTINGKAVDVKVPTVYATDLQYDQTKGIIKLIGADGSVIGSIDTNLERVIKSGRYDTAKQELVFVTDDGSEIRVPVGDLVDTYTGDGTTITVQDNVFSVAKAVMDQINSKANDAGVVHKAGDETVDGKKVFDKGLTSRGFLLNQNVEGDIISGTPGESRMVFTDKSNKYYSNIISTIESAGKSRLALDVRSSGSYKDSTSLVLYANGDKHYIACTPTPLGANAGEIVTAGYLNTASTVVHTTGNEMISGGKTFSGYALLNNSLRVSPTGVSIPRGMRLLKSGGSLTGEQTELGFIGMNSDTSPIQLTSGNGVICSPTPGGANGNEIVTAGWANGKYVGLSGDQTINGTKTFADNMHTTRTIPDSYSTFFFKATKNRDIEPKGRSELFSYIRTGGTVPSGQNDYIGAIGVQREADGTYSHNVNVQAYDSNGVQKTSSSVRAVANLDGTHYATASYRIANQSDGDIVTFGMVPTLNDIVHTTGNQTIAGEKTFTGKIRFKENAVVIKKGPLYEIYDENLTKGVKPDTGAMDGLRFGDVKGNVMGGVRFKCPTSGYNEAYIEIYNFDGTVRSLISAIAPETGDAYATCPHRSTGQSNDDIVTYGMLKELGLIKG